MIERIGVIGGGVMAEAIVRGLVGQGIARPEAITVSDPLPERRSALRERHGIRTIAENRGATRDAPIVILAIKPQQMADVLADLRGAIDPDQLLISIAAGVPITQIVVGLAHDRVVRVMPNTPAQIGAGMSVWTASPAVTAPQRGQVRAILGALGHEVSVADEGYLDMATALNGSGPAYLFLFLEAFIDAGVHLGLPRPLASDLALQTVLGSAQMARETGRHPAELKNLVTSPGGTTAAGLAALEDGRLRAVIDRAVLAAFERSRELGREIKKEQPG